MIKVSEYHGEGTITIKENFSNGFHYGNDYRLNNFIYVAVKKTDKTHYMGFSVEDARLMLSELERLITMADTETARLNASKRETVETAPEVDPTVELTEAVRALTTALTNFNK